MAHHLDASVVFSLVMTLTQIIVEATYISSEHMSGLSIRYPVFRSLYSSLLVIPGYGMPPEMSVQNNAGLQIENEALRETQIDLQPFFHIHSP